jgi:D-alanyl-lipoteichoic acid acyltransferase DltB (MBOAT superfamily)
MTFPTLDFAVFFAVVFPVSWLLMPYRRLWKLFMIAASYVFYGSAGEPFVFLIAACTLWNAAMAHFIWIASRRPRWQSALVTAAVTGDLVLLGWFKYYGFFVQSVISVSARFGVQAPLPLVQFMLPIGISFFTFQAISYVVDVKRGRTRPVAFLDFALYLSFFPHVVAGPIVRAVELVPQFGAPRNPRRVEAVRAFGLITAGLLKKVVVADTIASQIVDPVFGSPSLHSRIDILAAIYGYAVQIYCDFSGYTDIAIGLALLLGFHFPQNFNRPYTAITFQDFWRRWHMSLSRWLRDYLYIGLGGNRKGKARTYINLMVTMLLGGLWHGAAWNFVFWGGIHGLGLSLERWWHDRHGSRGSSRVSLPLIRWFLTFNVVCLAWVFFRAPDLATVGELVRGLASSGGQTSVSAPLAMMIAGGFAAQFLPHEPLRQLRVAFNRLSPVAQGGLLALVLFATGVIVSGQGVAPFIYYRF